MYSNIFQREFPYHQTCSNGNLTFVSWDIRLIHRRGAYPCNLLEPYNPDFLRCHKYAGLYRFFPAFLTLLQKIAIHLYSIDGIGGNPKSIWKEIEF